MTLFSAGLAHLVMLVDLGDLGISFSQDLRLLRRDCRVIDGYGETSQGSVMEAGGLETIEDGGDLGHGVGVAHILHQTGYLLLIHDMVDEGVVLREYGVEHYTADAGFQTGASGMVLEDTIGGFHLGVLLKTHEYACLDIHICTGIIGSDGILEVHECTALTREGVAHGGYVEQTDDHVL